MSLATLPAEILYDIVGDIVSSYIDLAITIPPSNVAGADGIPNTIEFRRHDEHGRNGWRDFQLSSDEEDSDDSADEGDVSSNDGDVNESDNGDASATGQDAPRESQNDSDEDSEWESDDDDDDEDDDEDEDSSDEETEPIDVEEAERELSRWKAVERLDPLPPNTVLPLFAASRSIRAAAQKVMLDALGTTLPENSRVPWDIVRYLRSNYRLAHQGQLPLAERHFRHFPFEIPRTMLVRWYLCLALTCRRTQSCIEVGGAKMHDRGGVAMSRPPPVPQAVLGSRVRQRLGLMFLRQTFYLQMDLLCYLLSDSLEECLELRGRSKNPKHDKCVAKIDGDMENLLEFDEMLTRRDEDKINPTITADLVKTLPIHVYLINITRLRKAKIPGFEDIIQKAFVLKESWDKRALGTTYDVIG